MARRCDECLFSSAKIVSDSRKEQILADCRETGNYFICHKDTKACCRGYYDAGITQNVQVIKRLYDFGFPGARELVRWVTDPKDDQPEEQEQEKE